MNCLIEISASNSRLKVWKTLSLFCGHELKEQISDLLPVLHREKRICLSNISSRRKKSLFTLGPQTFASERRHAYKSDLWPSSTFWSHRPDVTISQSVFLSTKTILFRRNTGQTSCEMHIIVLFRRTQHWYFLSHVQGERSGTDVHTHVWVGLVLLCEHVAAWNAPACDYQTSRCLLAVDVNEVECAVCPTLTVS